MKQPRQLQSGLSQMLLSSSKVLPMTHDDEKLKETLVYIKAVNLNLRNKT